MLREPTTDELVTYVCHVQPELDRVAALRILSLGPAVREGLAEDLRHQRERAESLLELHLQLEPSPV